MLEFLSQISIDLILFIAKVVIILGSVGILIKSVLSGQSSDEGSELKITHLNETYKKQKIDITHALLTPEMRKYAEKQNARDEKSELKAKKKKAKQDIKANKKNAAQTSADSPNLQQTPQKSRLFVLNFKGDIQASAVESLRKEITAILQVAGKDDEVLLKLNNSGGYVHTHGLAASQLTRITDAGYKLTIAIDQVAASGGYMMACVGQKIIAAPFAIIGSIGVVAQVPNVHRLLKKHDIDVELHTAGQFKRTLTMLGENTEEGRQKFVEDLHKTHDLFQNFVKAQRATLNVEEVATGETWYGSSALEIGLVDEVKTSDEYIMQSLDHYEVFSLEFERKKKMGERALSLVHNLLGGRLPEM